jgi:cobalamin synthase
MHASPQASHPLSGLWSALHLLLPIRRGDPVDEAAATRAIHWIVPIGVVTGLVYACLYRGSWRCFGEVHGIRLMPAACVWIADLALLGCVLWIAAARVFGRLLRPSRPSCSPPTNEPGLVLLAPLVILAGLKLVLWVAIPEGVSTWPGIWGSALNFAYPHAFYRTLILAPIWGRWGVVLAANLGRCDPAADGLTRGLTAQQSPQRVLGWFIPITALTAVYCGYNGKWMVGCVIALAVLGTTYLFGVFAGRRLGGQNRDTLLAAGLVAELSYLIVSAGLSARIYAT